MMFNSKLAKISIVVIFMVAAVLTILCAPAAASPNPANFTIDRSRSYDPEQFFLKYDVNSSFSLPTWCEVLADYSSLVPGMALIKTPEGMGVQYAIAYFSTIDGAIWAEPDYISTMRPSETDAKRIYSGTRQDRIGVYYINASGEHLPWEVISKSNMSYSPDVEESALLQIPEGMSLVEAIEYCSTISNVLLKPPWSEYISTVIEGNTYDIKDLNTRVLRIGYKPNSSYRLPWSHSEYSVGSITFFTYVIPDNMTFAEAYAYCNTIDDIIGVAFDYRAEPADAISFISSESPVPLLGILLGLLGSAAVFAVRRKIK